MRLLNFCQRCVPPPLGRTHVIGFQPTIEPVWGSGLIIGRGTGGNYRQTLIDLHAIGVYHHAIGQTRRIQCSSGFTAGSGASDDEGRFG